MKLFLTFVLLVFSSTVGAQDTIRDQGDGNALLPRCQAAVESIDKNNWKDSHESFSTGFCVGLIEGITYVSPIVCPPKGVSLAQEYRVVVKFLQDNPDKLNVDESLLAEIALAKAFPCPKKQAKPN